MVTASSGRVRLRSMPSLSKISVQALGAEGARTGAPVPGALVQPWLVMLKPPFEELADRAAAGGRNGDLRVVVEIDDADETIPGAVYFDDPLDQGLLAAVLLDRPSRAEVVPLPVPVDHRPSAALAAVYGYLDAIGTDAAVPLVFASPPTPHPTETALPELQLGWPPADLPHVPPQGWPPAVPWPPSGDVDSLRLICWMMPCLRCCPHNNGCTVPDPVLPTPVQQ